MNPTINDKLASIAQYQRECTNLQSSIDAFRIHAKQYQEKGDDIRAKSYLNAAETYESMLRSLIKP